ncbi:hypothetical protein SDJN03_11085, partial [Cucurbita argyrosperma subsp. sororia]
MPGLGTDSTRCRAVSFWSRSRAWAFLLGAEEGTVPLGRAARKRLCGDGVVGRSLAACDVRAEDANRRSKRRGKVTSVKRAAMEEKNE